MPEDTHLPAHPTAEHPPRARRRRPSFTAEQWVPYPVPHVFDFFSNPENLPRLMPPWQDARIDSMELTPPADARNPQSAGRGSRILLSFRPVPLSPIRLRWLALIDDYVADQRFCDLQVSGPFGFWRHCHSLTAERHGALEGTRITDAVDYDWPIQSISPLIDMFGGRLQIQSIFRFRHRATERLLAQG